MEPARRSAFPEMGRPPTPESAPASCESEDVTTPGCTPGSEVRRFRGSDSRRALRPGGVQQASSGSLSEETLVRLWAGQRFPASALVTTAGVPLRVLHPGRRGRGAGPDFRDAIIAPPSGALLRGDVELHRRTSDFRAHGHATDGRYDRVVLHVVFEEDGAGETALACGRSVPVVALAAWTRKRAGELSRWLATPPLWREPCRDAIARLGQDDVLRVLDEHGDARLARREAALAHEITTQGAGAALYRALLDALGYGGARELMSSLAAALPWPLLREALVSVQPRERVALAEALLLQGAAGELDGPLRPANHPARRLAGLARLLARHWPLEEVTAEGAPRELVAAWSAAGGRDGSALIGRARAIELLVNAVLPWRAACCESAGDPEGASVARATFVALPRPARYGNLSFLEANLGADGRLAINARRQQGLLALYKDECTQGGCGRCALS